MQIEDMHKLIKSQLNFVFWILLSTAATFSIIVINSNSRNYNDLKLQIEELKVNKQTCEILKNKEN